MTLVQEAHLTAVPKTVLPVFAFLTIESSQRLRPSANLLQTLLDQYFEYLPGTPYRHIGSPGYWVGKDGGISIRVLTPILL
jgi:hypothetical protein